MLVVIALIPVCAVSVLVRFRRAGSLERQQIKWLLVAVATTLIGFVVANAMDAADVGAVPVGVAEVAVLLALLAIPVSIGVAVLRYQLLDIDVIISRGTVYLALTAGVVTSYLGIVALMAALFDTERTGAVSLVATGLVALVFAPLRHWLQQHVNRWVYGDRADPYAVVSRIGRRLEEADAPRRHARRDRRHHRRVTAPAVRGHRTGRRWAAGDARFAGAGSRPPSAQP